MKTKSLIGWLTVLVVLVALGWWTVQYLGLGMRPGAVGIEKRTVNASSPDGAYAISIEYPAVYGLASSALEQKVNREIEGDLDGLATAFKEDINQDAMLKSAASSSQAALTITYAIPYQDDHLMSVQFDSMIYSSDAAHPNSFTATLVYNLDTGTVVGLDDLFKQGSNYLSFLSTYTAKAVALQLGDAGTKEVIAAGTAPKAENFKSYMVTPRGLVIIFDPYQVAAYAAGPQKVTIPWDATDIFSPDSVAGRFMTN
jgi:hypothetical protein